MMIAKLVNIGAGALLFGSVCAVVATSLPATGRTINNGQPGQRSADRGTDRAQVVSGPSTRTSLKRRSTSKLLPGLRGKVLEARREHQQKDLFKSNASSTSLADWQSITNLTKDLKPGQRLHRGDSLFSALGGFRLTLDRNGNLALYDIDDAQLNGDVRAIWEHRPEVMKMYTNVIWSAETSAAGPDAGPASYCVMQADGNFVVYDKAGRLRLESGTRGNPGAFLRCQDDGNLVIYTPEMTAIWTSATDAGDRPNAQSDQLDAEPSSGEN